MGHTFEEIKHDQVVVKQWNRADEGSKQFTFNYKPVTEAFKPGFGAAKHFVQRSKVGEEAVTCKINDTYIQEFFCSNQFKWLLSCLILLQGSNPDPPFLFLIGFIGNFLCAFWIGWHLLFYAKSPLTYQQDLLFIIIEIFNLSSTNNYFLTVLFKPSLVIKTSCHSHIFCKILTSFWVYLYSHLQINAWISSKGCLIFIVSWGAFPKHNWPYSIKVWFLWPCHMQHSCLQYFKGQWSNWCIGITIHMIVDTKKWFVYLPQMAYHLMSSKVCHFSPQVFHLFLLSWKTCVMPWS